MDRYQRVEKPREETPINENEIRITTQGRVRNYITYATTLFQVTQLFILVPLLDLLTSIDFSFFPGRPALVLSVSVVLFLIVLYWLISMIRYQVLSMPPM